MKVALFLRDKYVIGMICISLYYFSKEIDIKNRSLTAQNLCQPYNSF